MRNDVVRGRDSSFPLFASWMSVITAENRIEAYIYCPMGSFSKGFQAGLDLETNILHLFTLKLNVLSEKYGEGTDKPWRMFLILSRM